MPYYLVDIDGEKFVGEYSDHVNAVHGALRKRQIAMSRERSACFRIKGGQPDREKADRLQKRNNEAFGKGLVGWEELPPVPHGMAKAAYTRKLRSEYCNVSGNGK